MPRLLEIKPHGGNDNGAAVSSFYQCAALDLVRIVPSEKMARFYGVALQPTLFGEVAVFRCWGRIGTRGRAMTVTYPNAEQAADALADLEIKKRRRGYVTTSG